VDAVAQDSGGNEWDHASTQWVTRKHCGEPYAGVTKQVVEEEQKNRIEKAKKRLNDLLDSMGVESDKTQCFCRDCICRDSNLVEMSREYIALYRGLNGEEDWRSSAIFKVHFLLATALRFLDRFQESEEVLRLAFTKLKDQKFKGYK
jgi:hypothetical protein